MTWIGRTISAQIFSSGQRGFPLRYHGLNENTVPFL
jgi:hypothetical protein